MKQQIFLVMMAIHPITKKKWYFIDKCLPFSSSRSCAIFQTLSDALAYLAQFRIMSRSISNNPAITNYLDDFLFIALCMLQCNAMMDCFLELCSNIGCPISDEKTEWASDLMVFLGTLLNGKLQVITVLIDKVTKTLSTLYEAISKCKVTIKFVQHLTGTLNFLNKTIVPGRAFTRGMYEKLKLKDAKGEPLKQHHHVYLNKSFIQDCKVWVSFLKNSHRVQLCRLFSDFDFSQKHTILSFYSDASLNAKLGFGAVFNNHWLAGQWNAKFIELCKPSIKFLELYALVIALTAWRYESQLQNQKIVIFCDNQAVVHMVNNLASSCMHCQKLIRILVLQAIIFGQNVRVHYIASKLNHLADALSRLDFARFWRLAPKNMDPLPCKLPSQLWPIQKIWDDDKFDILLFNFS